MRHTRQSAAAFADAFEHYAVTRRPSTTVVPEPGKFDHLSDTELRLELAEAEAQRVTTWKGRFLKQDRIEAVTAELLERGAF